MKKLILLLFLFVVSSLSFAQVVFVSSSANDSITGTIPQCENELTMSIGVGNNTDVVTLYIDWGDGSTTDSTFSLMPGQWFTFNFTHAFAAPGAYTGSYTVYSNYLSANFVEDVEINFISSIPESCGYAPYAYIFQLSPGISFGGVPLDFTGNDGLTTTITPLGISNVYLGLNTTNAPYSVDVNPSWLSTNGLVQVSGSGEITGFEATGQAIVTGMELMFEVNCDTPAADNDVAFNYGWVSNFVAPLESGSIYLNFCNFACENTTDAQVTIEMPADFVPNTTGLTGATVVGTILTFDILDLDNCQTIIIPFAFPGVTPAGTVICFPVAISAPDDTDLSNNTDTICGIVLNSYDPNDKQVNQPAIIDPDMQETFVYQIRFQNDGNFPAVNVVVRDTLSTNLDLSTFKLLETSHPVAYQVNPSTREVTFTFNAIWLESSDVDLDASQGFILFEIDEAAGLSEGDAIENTAYIFFDFNPAIVTNTTVNTNNYPVGIIENEPKNLVLYPNPASSSIKFSGDEVQKVVIYDVLGQVVMTKTITNNSLSLINLNNGVYFVEMHTESGIQTKRLVVSR